MADKRRALLVLVLTVLCVGCGYSLAGRGSYLPAHIRTIGIPPFVNRTAIFNVEQVLTERVRQEFNSRGEYKVVPNTSNVDAVLTGEISRIETVATAFTPEQQVSRYAFRLITKLELRDVKTNQVVWQDPARMFSEEYDLTSSQGSADPKALLGADASALDRIADDFARTTVSAILEAF
ncbi:MAG: LPS assembly lipoprotein LptE [Vicinamibacteraceae bacterium]